MGVDRSPTKPRSRGVTSDTSAKPMPSGVFGETYNLKDNLKEGGGVCGGAGCGKKVGERQNGIQCDACLKWFHCGCGGLSKKDYECIKSMTDSTIWVCGNCEGFVKGAKERMNRMEEENKYLRNLNEELKSEMKRFFEELSRVKSEVKREIKDEILAEIRKEMEKRCDKGMMSMKEVDLSNSGRIETEKGKKEEIKKEIKNELLSEVKEDEEIKRRDCNVGV